MEVSWKEEDHFQGLKREISNGGHSLEWFSAMNEVCKTNKQIWTWVSLPIGCWKEMHVEATSALAFALGPEQASLLTSLTQLHFEHFNTCSHGQTFLRIE